MAKLLANILIIYCCGWLMLTQPGNTLRIKRDDSHANATGHLKQDTAKAGPTQAPLTALAVIAVQKPQENTNATGGGAGTAVAPATAKATNSGVAATATAKTKATATLAAAAGGEELLADRKLELLEETQPFEFAGRLHRGKRRMALADDSTLPRSGHHARHHASPTPPAPPSPYLYFNKMVSPDGKQELKEFQLLSPNVVIESVQHDMNYGPVPDMGGLLLINADNGLNGHIHGLSKAKHHHKHKSSLALPPFLYLLQQMLQPNLSLDVDAPAQRNHLDIPIYQFIDGAVDNALRNNHDTIDELNDKDKEKDRDGEINEKAELIKENKLKDAIEVAAKNKNDELIVSCPIHHEHHASNNGEIMDDDVVLVNECHIV